MRIELDDHKKLINTLYI